MILSANLRGAALMTGSMACFTVNDAFMKLMGTELPFFQVLFLRSVGVVLLLWGLARAFGALRLPARRDRWLVAARTLAEIGAAYFFLSALMRMPIANVTAIIQALPLTVTLGAALFFGEPVGWRRWSAIVVGFVGVFLIIRPGGEGFTLDSVYALIAVLFVTLRDLAARRLSATVPSLSVALAAAVGVLVFSGAGALGSEWQAMSARHLIWLACAVGAILGGYLFSVMAMRVGEIAVVAPFRYTSLLVALLLGLFVFGEWPDALTLAGAGIVVATGIYTLWRERRSKRAHPVGLRLR